MKDEGESAGPERDVRSVDPLFACLRVLAKHFDRPASETALTAGLPIENGRFDPALFVRAAARVGISAAIENASLNAVVPLRLPAILFVDGGRPLLALSGGDGAPVRVFDPARDAFVETGWRELAAVYDGVCIPAAVASLARETGVDETLGPREHWLFGVTKRYWRGYMKVVIASASINLLALGSSLFTMNVYDRVLPNQAFATLWVLAAGVMLAFVFDFLLRIARSYIVDHIGRRVDLKVSSSIFERVLHASLKDRPATTGAFANRASEYEFVRDFFTSSTITLAIDILFTFVFLVVIYLLAGWIVVVPLVGIVAVVVIGLVVQALIGKKMAMAQEHTAMRHSVLVESISSIETIKSLRGEGYLLRRWDQLVRAGADLQEGIKSLSVFASSSAMFVQQLTGVWIVIAGVFRFAGGEMSMGAIIASVILAGRATAPLGQLAAMLAKTRQAMQALQTLDQIMALEDERDGAAHGVHRSITTGEIEFRNVEFAYPGSQKKTLTGATFKIRPGERVGIIGRIGSGKTTIGRLMAGLYLPTSGDVLIDGVDIRQYHPHEVRSSVALVVQDADLLYGSVKMNLLVGNPQADDSELVRAAALSGLDQIVAAHPMGFEMPVGEKGSNLSGGQRQIVALARSLVSPFKVLFLDEPTSAMDTFTERQLIARLRVAVPPGRTFVLCTHRHSALALVDRLLVVEGGRIVADGPKDEVLKALAEASSRTADPAAAQQKPAGPVPVTREAVRLEAG